MTLRLASSLTVNARETLRRNAEAWQNTGSDVKPSTKRYAQPTITPVARAEYKLALYERVKFHLQAGKSKAGASELALADLGCIEFWLFVNTPDAERPKCNVECRSNRPVVRTQGMQRMIDLLLTPQGKERIAA